MNQPKNLDVMGITSKAINEFILTDRINLLNILDNSGIESLKTELLKDIERVKNTVPIGTKTHQENYDIS